MSLWLPHLTHDTAWAGFEPLRARLSAECRRQLAMEPEILGARMGMACAASGPMPLEPYRMSIGASSACLTEPWRRV